MRQTTVLWKRTAQQENKVPFRMYLPLALKNRIQGAGRSSTGKNCIYEMSILLNCLQDNNYDNLPCSEQLKKFNSCVDDYQLHKSEEKKMRTLKIPKPGSNTFTGAQLTYFLKKYSNV